MGLTQALSDGTNTYIYGNGRIAQTDGTATDYFMTDALGSVRQLTDATGAITYASAYDPYGVVTATSGASGTPYGYTGEYTSNDLVYLRARHYDPAMGRFLTRDTWGGDANSPMSFNAWNYVNGNPVKDTDPSGFCVFCQVNDWVRVDTRGYKADGQDVTPERAAGVYSKPSPSSEKIFKMTDEQFVTVLSGAANINDMNWGWRQVSINANGVPIIGWVRNRTLLDYCGEASRDLLGCLPIKSFTKTFGFGPNNYARQLCEHNNSCVPYGGVRGLHNGLDFSTSASTPLIWAGRGEGTLQNYSNDAEPAFKVSYNGLNFIYGHSYKLNTLSYGERVRSGQYIGMTDNKNGHLHFGVRAGSIFYNPIHYFSTALYSSITDPSKMYGDGSYAPPYTAFSMISFDNAPEYSINKNYFFWSGCYQWEGIVMEDSFTKP